VIDMLQALELLAMAAGQHRRPAVHPRADVAPA
jgi:hypothetical protein